MIFKSFYASKYTAPERYTFKYCRILAVYNEFVKKARVSNLQKNARRYGGLILHFSEKIMIDMVHLTW